MDLSESEVKSLLDLVYERFHYDFRSYSMSSMRRRLRAALGALVCADLVALGARLAEDPTAFGRLLEYLTVQVSDMFRDPPFYAAMRADVVPELRTYPSLRVWVAGCSTGEEAYSLAILLDEEGLLDRTTLYATDIHAAALEKAEAGIYDIARLATFGDNHLRAGGKRALSEYYTAAYGAASFDRSLRRRIVFSDHSLATDHVFAEVQVVTCRNVLIYFDRSLQDRALGIFHESLCRRGFLGLGARETPAFSEHGAKFRPLGPDHWYLRP